MNDREPRSCDSRGAAPHFPGSTGDRGKGFAVDVTFGHDARRFLGGRRAGEEGVTPYYSDDLVTIWHGDCRELLPMVTADVVVTDPPYGIAWRTPESPRRPKSGMRVHGDDGPFAPGHVLALRRPTVLFGANHYADRLPTSPGWIVWDKREGMPSNDQSDAELAWTNFLGAVRTVRVLWNGGGSLLAENGPRRAIHPTQKPVRLMSAVLALAPAGSVLDPYVGTGTTLVAAKAAGRKAVGIEIEERYCEEAARRCSQETLGLVG